MKTFATPAVRLLVGLVVGLILAPRAAAQIGYAVNSDDDDHLYRIDLATGVATDVGDTGFSDIEGLAFHPQTGVLYGVQSETKDSDGLLVTCSLSTGACTSVGELNQLAVDPGLGFSCAGILYLSTEGDKESGDLFTVNIATGQATLVGSLGGGVDGHSIAFGPPTVGCASGAFLLDGDDDEPNLLCVNLANGAATLIGGNGVAVDGEPAMDFDLTGTLWEVENDDGLDLYTVSPTSGAATDVGYDMTAGGFDAFAIQGGFCTEQVAVIEIPTLSGAGLAGLGLGLAALGAWRVGRRPGRAP
jgi:hypothetical protein